MKYTWITQGSFLLESNGFRLAIDPYLSNFVEINHGLTRLKAPAFTVDSLKMDAVLCTHNHADHFDPIAIPEIVEKYENCIYAGPKSVIEKYENLNIENDKIISINLDEKIKIGSFSLTALPVIHSDEYGIGLLIETDNKKIFLSGDSEYSEEYAANIANLAFNVDLALICINGRLANMNDDDAFKVMKKIKPKLALPMHYGLFKENTANPAKFINNCNNINIKSFEMQQGKTYDL